MSLSLSLGMCACVCVYATVCVCVCGWILAHRILRHHGTASTYSHNIQSITSKQARDSTRLACRRRHTTHTHTHHTLICMRVRGGIFECSETMFAQNCTKIIPNNFHRTFFANKHNRWRQRTRTSRTHSIIAHNYYYLCPNRTRSRRWTAIDVYIFGRTLNIYFIRWFVLSAGWLFDVSLQFFRLVGKTQRCRARR